MNKNTIGENILRFRKEKGITQEELGCMIGISAGAISKWENGNSKPDIDILAPLARALSTTINDLFSFIEELEESEIKIIHKELLDDFLHKGFNEGEKKCLQYLNKYPNNIGLKYEVGGSIYMFSTLLEEDLGDKKRKYALSLLYEVVKSKDIKYSNTALLLIGNIQMELEDYEESEKCLQMLKERFVDPMIPFAALLEKQDRKDEAKGFCQGMLLMYVNQSTAMMSILSRIFKSEENYIKSEMYLKSVIKIENMFKIGLNSGTYNLCRLYIENGEKEKAAKCFAKYVEELLSFELNYDNNFYFDNVKLDVKEDGQVIMRKNMYKSIILDKSLKPLKGIKIFDVAIQKLKLSCE